MNIVALSGSNVGSKTKIAIDYTVDKLKETEENHQMVSLDLSAYDIQFSDGRNYLDYKGDTAYVAKTIMEADLIIIGTPIFQASIPATLKNIFDLLPTDGLRDKIVSMIVTAGSQRHYLVAEMQLKPILNYMKAHVVENYVFIEEKDYHMKKIINDDVFLRIDRLIEDAFTLSEVYRGIQKKKDAAYGF
ncbi:NADPH-dependent FMN reductase [Amphibacillus cookii]|uniref:NADPH-dependent FMN reductase n=1 Tax=Amphibacillus cookii TaxID=767787 RepID=UPI00195BE7D9|nr:NADPH-dependent FMN reductase [Amphibacillus cookii]MBM7542103.1 FMN reductase [Amphibacillus cookii]